MNTVEQYDFAGKRALVRVDFNVPLNEQNEITDDNRIMAALPTIEKILNDGGSIVLMSHLGRPKGQPSEKFSLKHIVSHLSKILNREVKFAADCVGDDAFVLSAKLQPGEVLLLENLRFHKEEEKGEEGFAEKLSRHGDVFVNDAFGTAHRAHASTTVVAKFFPGARMFGYLMAAELENAEKVLNRPERPLTAIMGGAKVSDKIMLIESLLDKVDNLIIGGGMAYTFTKAFGGNIGNSICEADKLDLARELVDKAKEKGVNLVLPVDCKIANDFSNDADTRFVSNSEIPDGWEGLDIGPESIKIFREVIRESKTILWNGPMGVFEFDNFTDGSRQVAEAIVEATGKGAFSLIGGGDSAACIAKFNMEADVSYVSTGGGALLEYMEGKELPGVKAIG